MTNAVIFGANGGIGGALVEALIERGGYDTIFAVSRSGATHSAAPPPSPRRIMTSPHSSRLPPKYQRLVGCAYAFAQLAFCQMVIICTLSDLIAIKHSAHLSTFLMPMSFAPRSSQNTYCRFCQKQSAPFLRRCRRALGLSAIIALGAGTPIAPQRPRSIC